MPRLAHGESVAQQVEHNTFNVGVLGSSPSGFTKIQTVLLGGRFFAFMKPGYRALTCGYLLAETLHRPAGDSSGASVRIDRNIRPAHGGRTSARTIPGSDLPRSLSNDAVRPYIRQ